MTLIETTCDQNREFYKDLFTQGVYWSASYPNPDEAARWLKIGEYLSTIAMARRGESKAPMRILDVGCGRGWLTNLVDVYGEAEGVDPVPESIELARRMYPHLKFFSGTATDVYKSSDSTAYDVIVTSEVIEHVSDKVGFVEDMVNCLQPEGYVILTTPRGELFDRWLCLGSKKQPVELWLTEAELSKLFRSRNFLPVSHSRVYIDLPAMSLVNRVCSSKKFLQLCDRLRLGCILKGLQYTAAIYQIWCFQYHNKKCL